MSIAFDSGDDGRTRIMFNRRARKDDPRVAACGAVDELSAFLGLARAKSRPRTIAALLLSCQRDLVLVGAELATLPRDRRRLKSTVSPEMTRRLEKEIVRLEKQLAGKLRGFAIPGNNETAALLDVCRCVARRAERAAASLSPRGQSADAHILPYLNRLSTLLFLLARARER